MPQEIEREKIELSKNNRAIIFVPTEDGFQLIPEGTEWIPLGALSLAANSKSKKDETGNDKEDVLVVDEALSELDFTKLPDTLEHIGFYATVTNYARILKIIKNLKKDAPDIVIGVGGPYVISLYREILCRRAEIDYVCTGYGEETWAQILLGTIPLEEIPNVAWLDASPEEREKLVKNPAKAKKKIKVGKHIMLKRDLENMELPDHSALSKNDRETRNKLYWEKHPGHKDWTVVSMSSADGCPAGPAGRCKFCSRYDNKYNLLPSKRYANHLAAQIEEYGQLVITETTDDFINIDFLRELDAELTRLNVNRDNFIIDFCFASVAKIISKNLKNTKEEHTEEVIELLKSLNVQRVLIGYEHRNKEMLKKLKRGLTPKQQDKATEAIIDAGIGIEAAFILGGKGETKETLQELIDYARKLVENGNGLVNLSVSVLTLLPPSENWTEAMENPEFAKRFSNKDILDVEKLQKAAIELFCPEITWGDIQDAIKELKSMDPSISMDFEPEEQ